MIYYNKNKELGNMFGKILTINGNECIIENLSKLAHSELMNCHIIYDDHDRKVVGEITRINGETINILLVGEIRNNCFYPGVVKKPSGVPRIINVGELETIIGSQKEIKDEIVLGYSPIYKNYKIKASLNSFFGNHSAIIGNTGSGKSCGVTRVLQNLFIKNEIKPINSHFIIFDAFIL